MTVVSFLDPPELQWASTDDELFDFIDRLNRHVEHVEDMDAAFTYRMNLEIIRHLFMIERYLVELEERDNA